MPSCAVANCHNYYRKTKSGDIVYHVFPKSSDLAKTWIVKCKRQDVINVKNARICSEHFLENDYVDDMKNRLLGLKERKILKPDAVPSVNLPVKYNECVATDRNNRKRKRDVLQQALNRLDYLSPKKKVCDSMTPEVVTETETNNICSLCSKLKKENDMLLKKVTFLEKEMGELRKRETFMPEKKLEVIKKEAKIKRLLTENRTFRKKLKKMEIENQKNSIIKKRLNTVFTSTQIKAIVDDKKKIRWTAEDISRSLVARALSRRSYEYWKNKIGIPLPSASTLKRWCAKFSCKPGILHNVLLLIKRNAESRTEAERVCCLSFDEMHVDSRVCYDMGEDRILGPFSKVQFVLARGIMSPWKQPLFYDFDTTMTKKLMFDIIKQAEESGLIVKAIVSDLGGCSKLWSELKISPQRTFFSHPCNASKRIWVFADPPHYLKLLRNHFIDSGLRLKDGTDVTTSVIEEILNKDRGEYKMCLKLKPNLLNVKGSGRQKVAPAKALFSASSSKAILLLTGNEKVSKFFELIDSFFDIMNSTHPYSASHKPLQSGYGIDKFISSQNEILHAMSAEISGMRVKGRKSLLPFQKGILISISSLFGLWEDLKLLKFKYILTSRLTQDVLESLFSQVRGAGYFYDHPSPVEVIYRLKNLMLANKLPALSSKTNTGDESINSYLTAEILQSAFKKKDVEEILQSSTYENEDFEAIANVPMEWKIEENISSRNMCFPEHEGLKYVAGYVAFRVRDPTLGTFSIEQNDFESAPWIHSLSEGGLIVPTNAWLQTVEDFESIFTSIHGKDGYHKGPNVTKDLMRILEEKYPHVNKSAIKIFSRVRTFIRIRFLNRNSVRPKRAIKKKNDKWKKSAK